MTAYPLTFRPDMLRALRAGAKTETRRLVKSSNTRVLPGTFECAELGTARVRISRHGTLTEIRARCKLPSGYRVVTAGPKVQPGDMFWTRKGRGARRSASRLTLLVTEVHARRLQDMSDEDADAEGVEYYPSRGTPRERFAQLWDEINGPGSWARNDWVWVYRFEVAHGNIDGQAAARRWGVAARRRSGAKRRRQ